jgi:hypothetical protein
MARRRSSAKRYRVFVSHAGDDIWVAQQIAKNIEGCGASTFLDRRDIAAGDELLALFTPWSRCRAWVRHEIGMADIRSKRIICVFYHVAIADFQADEDGLGPLEGLNVLEINKLDVYFGHLRERIK